MVTVDLLTLGLTNALLLILPLRDWTDVLVMQNGAKLSHPLLFITCHVIQRPCSNIGSPES